VVDGITGRLVPPGDPAALADALAALLRDPHLRSTMGRAGRERVARDFTVQQMAHRTEALYEELWNRRKQ
ncbi:MAG: glycosyltransferase, partial [Anaerolineae bacterium]|nr:glycosyltransferase [Anaerolineae bacterium]